MSSQTASAVSTRPDSQPYPPRRIYSVVGVPPEIQAYALAKYSRSSQGMLEAIQELSAQKAEQFLNTFYFQYGLFTVGTYCMYGRNRVRGRKRPVHVLVPVPLRTPDCGSSSKR